MLTALQPVIDRTYLVELNLGTIAQGKKINFQYIPQLEGASIYAIQTFSATDVGTSPNNIAVVSTAALAVLIVNFFVGDDEMVYQYPLSDLRSPNINGYVRMFNMKKINLTKSFVTILSSTGLTDNYSVLFQFIFSKS